MSDTTPRRRRALPDYDTVLRQNARTVLLEAGCDPARLEAEVDRILSQPLLFDVPSEEALRTRYARR